MLRLQDTDSELTWCAVQTANGREALAASEIVRVGLSCFWPRYRVNVKVNGSRHRVRPVNRSLFPSYVFAGYEPGTQEWRRVCSVPGQERVLTSSYERPHPVPQAFLRSLLGHEAELAHNLRMARIAFGIKAGDRVRVKDGPFTGLYAKLTELDDDGRICLLLDVLGRKVPVSGMTGHQVEPA